MRDHKRLRAFQLANELVKLLYKNTVDFPKQEMFGLASQMRRAAVSIPSNIVEGCARTSQSEYVRFLEISYASSRELDYQIDLSSDLGFLDEGPHKELKALSEETSKVLNGLVRSLRKRQ